MTAGSLACVRYARFQRLSGGGGSCEGACRHYVECKEDSTPRALETCKTECRDIYVYNGEADRESLAVFEGLDCKATIGFVEGNGGRHRTVTSQRVKTGRPEAP
ncbi:MAG TPA: hypothetical protein VK698_09130 [Kofleriaceae bacterium]|nr:hypothetical protein [Kofleriaceae bacterium]